MNSGLSDSDSDKPLIKDLSNYEPWFLNLDFLREWLISPYEKKKNKPIQDVNSEFS